MGHDAGTFLTTFANIAHRVIKYIAHLSRLPITSSKTADNLTLMCRLVHRACWLDMQWRSYVYCWIILTVGGSYSRWLVHGGEVTCLQLPPGTHCDGSYSMQWRQCVVVGVMFRSCWSYSEDWVVNGRDWRTRRETALDCCRHSGLLRRRQLSRLVWRHQATPSRPRLLITLHKTFIVHVRTEIDWLCIQISLVLRGCFISLKLLRHIKC